METTTTPSTPASTPGGFALDTDPRVLLLAAIMTGSEVIGAVRPDQLAHPSPCSEFDVRDVLGHLVSVLARVSAIGRGENPMAVSTEGEAADDGWLAAWLAAAADATEAWADGTGLSQTVVLPWATDTGAVALLGYVSEITVHTWDVAQGIGMQPAWNEEVVGYALALMKTWLPGAGRAEIFAEVHRKMGVDESLPGPFAEVVPVPDDAALIDQLVAWNGRRP